MAERAGEAAFAVARVDGARRARPLRPAIALVTLLAAIVGIGWTARGPSEGEAPRLPAPPSLAAIGQARSTPRPAVAPADSIVLGGRHPDREHGTDGLLGGIVFGGSTEP